MISIYDLFYHKEAHEGHKVIYVLFQNKEFVFRTLTRKEYRDITNLTQDDHDMEDAICQAAILEPADIDFENYPLAGVSAYACPMIVEASNFTSLGSVLDAYEKGKRKTKQFDQECMAVVKAAMPEYSYEQMEDWTWDRLMLAVARAERILNLKGHNIQLTTNQQEVEEYAENSGSDNKAFVDELRANGMDPMIYFKDEFNQKKDFMDFPLIGGVHWQNEGVMNAIRTQMGKAKNTESQIER